MRLLIGYHITDMLREGDSGSLYLLSVYSCARHRYDIILTILSNPHNKQSLCDEIELTQTNIATKSWS